MLSRSSTKPQMRSSRMINPAASPPRPLSPTFGTRTSSLPIVGPPLPREFRALVKYAKSQQSTLNDVDELRAWVDQQIQASRQAFSMELGTLTVASSQRNIGDDSPPVGSVGSMDQDNHHLQAHQQAQQLRRSPQPHTDSSDGGNDEADATERRRDSRPPLRVGEHDSGGGFRARQNSSSLRLSSSSMRQRQGPFSARSSGRTFSLLSSPQLPQHRPSSDFGVVREQVPELPLGSATVPQFQLGVGGLMPLARKNIELSPAVSALSRPTDARSMSNNNVHAPLGLRLISKLQQRKAGTDEFSGSMNAPSLGSDDMLHSPRDAAGAQLSTVEVKQYIEARRDTFWTSSQIASQRFLRVSQLFRLAMNLVSLVMIFFTAFSLAARVGGTSHHVPAELCWIELALDVVSFLFVIIVNLWIPYEDGGHVVFDAKAIALRYLRDPTLAFFDVVSNFPALVVLAPLGLQNFEYARVNLLLREIKLPRVLDTLEELLLPPTMHPSLVRLGKYFLYLVLIITHLSTVFMLVLRYESEHAVEAWMEMSLDSLEHDPVYWFLRCWREMLSAIAEKRLSYPHEDVEYIAGLILLIFALATIAVILASFEEIIVTEIDSGNQLTAKIEATIAALEHRGLPDEFQEEVAEYYERMWEINRTFDFEVADDVLAELPDGLHADVEFECNARIIRTIPLFGQLAANPRFVRLLVGQLRQVVIMPGAPIVQKGEDGDCMFFLSSGDAAVMNEEGDQELVTLGVGAFFGEVTMLFGGTRDRDIIAKTVCVCAVITAEHFEQVLQEYPEALEGILDVAVARAQGKLKNRGGVSNPSPSADPVVLVPAARPDGTTPEIQLEVPFDDPFAKTESHLQTAGASTATANQPVLTPIQNNSFFDDGAARTSSVFRDALMLRLRGPTQRATGAQDRSYDRSAAAQLDPTAAFLASPGNRPLGSGTEQLNILGLLEESCMVPSSRLPPSGKPRNSRIVAASVTTTTS